MVYHTFPRAYPKMDDFYDFKNASEYNQPIQRIYKTQRLTTDAPAGLVLEQSASEVQSVDDRRLVKLTQVSKRCIADLISQVCFSLKHGVNLSNVVQVIEDTDPQAWRLTGTGTS